MKKFCKSIFSIGVILCMAVFASEYAFAQTSFTISCQNGQIAQCIAAPPPVVTSAPVSGCDPATKSSKLANGAILTRQCAGDISWGQYVPGFTNAALTDLNATLHGTIFGTYSYKGLTFIPTIKAGQFISLAFSAASTTVFQMGFNATYGIPGVVSVSASPGDFSPATAYCTATQGDGIGIYAGGKYPGYCSVPLNTVYYLNFAAINSNGTPACNPGKAPCASAYLAYTVH